MTLTPESHDKLTPPRMWWSPTAGFVTNTESDPSAEPDSEWLAGLPSDCVELRPVPPCTCGNSLRLGVAHRQGEPCWVFDPQVVHAAFARIRVQKGNGELWPVVERVSDGWRSGEHRYSDADVLDVSPLLPQEPAETDSTQIFDQLRECREALVAIYGQTLETYDHASKPIDSARDATPRQVFERVSETLASHRFVLASQRDGLRKYTKMLSSVAQALRCLPKCDTVVDAVTRLVDTVRGAPDQAPGRLPAVRMVSSGDNGTSYHLDPVKIGILLALVSAASAIDPTFGGKFDQRSSQTADEAKLFAEQMRTAMWLLARANRSIEGMLDVE